MKKRFKVDNREAFAVVEPNMLSYEDFPPSKALADGMKTLQAEFGEISCYYRHNVVYAHRDGLDLTLQIVGAYTSGQGEKRYPLAVFVQGSGWRKQDVYCNLPRLADFAKRGYVVAIVEYRPSTVAPFPAQVQDTKTAIRFLRKNAAEFHILPDQVFLWGDSSGGHTAVLAGITQDRAELDNQGEEGLDCGVKAIVDYYGPMDISKMNEAPSIQDHYGADSPEGLLIGGNPVLEHPELVQPTVPMNYINRGTEIPPILILHGDKDRLVPFEQSILLYEKLKQEGKTAALYKIQGADHGGGVFWTDRIYQIIEDFLALAGIKK